MKILVNLAVAVVAVGVYVVWGLIGSAVLLSILVAVYVFFYRSDRRNSSRLTNRLLQMTSEEREAAIALLEDDLQDEVRMHMKKHNI